jgi:hypothetical protein
LTAQKSDIPASGSCKVKLMLNFLLLGGQEFWVRVTWPTREGPVVGIDKGQTERLPDVFIKRFGLALIRKY